MNLISGKEALIALANGEIVEYREHEKDGFIGDWSWNTEELLLSWIKHDHYEFRLKPRTITLNSIEVPAPFEPKDGDWFYYPSPEYEDGFGARVLHDDTPMQLLVFGAWRTKEEIKQVVDALRKVFKEPQQ